ncbi:hypothetical protein B7P43_G00500 [Cryptotermes secundus]|uniref:Lipase domain-containing protein n=1 Tax=Cryptotermes secundus TaxID=105785 RepID=A0A2J7R8F0_9NEOP|nr:hypothetical protein B7P43_G00500 [Cryptotermes secundus]
MERVTSAHRQSVPLCSTVADERQQTDFLLSPSMPTAFGNVKSRRTLQAPNCKLKQVRLLVSTWHLQTQGPFPALRLCFTCLVQTRREVTIPGLKYKGEGGYDGLGKLFIWNSGEELVEKTELGRTRKKWEDNTASRGTTISFLPADIHQPEGVHYFAGIPWMMIPGDEGVSHLAIFAETSPPVTRDARDIADDVIFNLYTNSRGASTPYTLRVNDTENLRKSGFDPTIPTKILVHGFAGDGDSANIINSKDAYLAKGNYNIIGVDWSVLCPSPNYIAAARNAVLTGELTAQLVEFLVAEAGARLQDVHIIGHSLGAQVAGFAGNSTITGKVARITGLDAAYPLFGNAEPAGRLDAGDAILVDTIHTCGGSVGFREPYGHVDFFPNGGDSPQPGCDGEITGEYMLRCVDTGAEAQ